MAIDWASLVAGALAGTPEEAAEGAKKPAETAEKAADCVCPHLKSGDVGTQVGTKTETQAYELMHLFDSVPTNPTAPTDFEEDQETDSNDYLYVIDGAPGGGGPQGGFAPRKEQAGRRCKDCARLYRPGLSEGYCGAERADLPPAYGEGHPLRKLPADEGASCAEWLHFADPHALGRH